MPGKPQVFLRGPGADERCFEHLAKHHRIDRYTASVRLHRIKFRAGVGAADDVAFGLTGDVYIDRGRATIDRDDDHIGMLSDPAA